MNKHFPRKNLAGAAEGHASAVRQSMTAWPVFNIFIAYGNFAAALRAQEMRLRLAARFRHEAEVTGETWNFALLANEHLLEQASIQAADADMILISTDSAFELPAHVRTWLESLPPGKPTKQALVALLDSANENEMRVEPIRSYLRQIAGRSGMDFLCNADKQGQEPGRMVPALDLPESQLALLQNVAPQNSV
jgi:hypothetical protein